MTGTHYKRFMLRLEHLILHISPLYGVRPVLEVVCFVFLVIQKLKFIKLLGFVLILPACSLRHVHSIAYKRWIREIQLLCDVCRFKCGWGFYIFLPKTKHTFCLIRAFMSYLTE